jgi:predicted AlkP superfamily phosphohydrolase/phosphomutase/Tfp pilus assembly protein PilF
MGKRLAKKVLVIGWDAAEWKVINPLIAQGKMPTLEKLIRNGVSGRIATLNPPLSPMLWTSIATGMRADKHGILGFIEPDTENGGVRPVTNTSRKVKAIWNILNQNGFKSNVVGWWPSHPAEPINGAMVSNFYHYSNLKDPGVPVPAGAIYPPELTSELGNIRIHPTELTQAHVLPFIPNAAAIDQEKDYKLTALLKYLADCSTVHAAGTWLMENKEWDFMAVYYDAIDHFSHVFMKYHPPRMKDITEAEFDIYKDVVASAYRFHDMMLERLLELAGEDTTVILLSDHGFYSDDKRLAKLPNDSMAPAFEHGPYGIICISGPNIQKGEKLFGATLLDITPTILTLFGLPIGKDMDGKVLAQAFNQQVMPEEIESWELIKGEDGRHSAELQQDPWEAKEAMQQLIELGYIEAPDDDKQKALDALDAESKYNLALAYMSGRKHEKALPLLEEIYNKNPKKYKYASNLFSCYQNLNKVKDGRKLIDKMKLVYQNFPSALNLLEGTILIAEGRFLQALECLKKVEQVEFSSLTLQLELGKVYLSLRRYAEAEKVFLRALEIDAETPLGYHGLGVVYNKTGRYEEAVDAFLKAIDLLFYFPLAHYHLGETLFLMGNFEEAAEAFKVCVKLSPGIKKAHNWLAKIYEEKLGNKLKADEHRKFVRENIKEKIIIISGLPRSGTSMMMQMLHAGGLEALTDNLRMPDISNPKGYFEFENVKKLAREKQWLKEAHGKAVKVIAQLLQHLPPDYEYQIIFMKRELDQVIRSQQIMLKKEVEIKANTYPAILANTFKKQLDQIELWLNTQPNMEVIYLDYSEVIENGRAQAEKIRDFLGMELDLDKMCEAIDPSLFRNNKSPWN